MNFALKLPTHRISRVLHGPQELELALGRAEWEKPKKPAAKKMPMPKKMPESLQRLGEENTCCVFFFGGGGKGVVKRVESGKVSLLVGLWKTSSFNMVDRVLYLPNECFTWSSPLWCAATKTWYDLFHVFKYELMDTLQNPKMFIQWFSSHALPAADFNFRNPIETDLWTKSKIYYLNNHRGWSSTQL